MNTTTKGWQCPVCDRVFSPNVGMCSHCNKTGGGTYDKKIEAWLQEGVEYITEPEAASLLEIEPATMRSWRFRQVGPPYIKFRQEIRYRLDDIIKYGDRVGW